MTSPTLPLKNFASGEDEEGDEEELAEIPVNEADGNDFMTIPNDEKKEDETLDEVSDEDGEQQETLQQPSL